MKLIKTVMPDVLLVAGVGCVTVGLWWVSPAAAMAVLGALLIVGGLRMAP